MTHSEKDVFPTISSELPKNIESQIKWYKEGNKAQEADNLENLLNKIEKREAFDIDTALDAGRLLTARIAGASSNAFSMIGSFATLLQKVLPS